MTDLVTYLTGLPQPWGAIISFALGVVGLASVLAAQLPQANEGTVWYWLRKIVDFVANNFRNAKNAPPSP